MIAMKCVPCTVNFWVLVCWASLSYLTVFKVHGSLSNGEQYVISNIVYPETSLKHYDWRYIRVEISPWFSSMSMILTSNADYDEESSKKLPKDMLPVICIRVGGPPLPDASNNSLKREVLDVDINRFLNDIRALPAMDQCFFFQKSLALALTNEQVSPGILYIGFFNGIGPVRTQSKMINRGPTYRFSANISVLGCSAPSFWGPYCNQTFVMLSCAKSDLYKNPRNLLDLGIHKPLKYTNYDFGTSGFSMDNDTLTSRPKITLDGHSLQKATPNFHVNKPVKKRHLREAAEDAIICKNPYGEVCLKEGEWEVYSLELLGISSQLNILAGNIAVNQTSNELDGNGNNSVIDDQIQIMAYACHDAIPTRASYDHSGNISNNTLTIQFPKLGRWYIAIYVIGNHSRTQGDEEVVCFSLEWQIDVCPSEKAGANCTWDRNMLQRVLRRGGSVPFESYYVPTGEKSAVFPLGPLLSNSSFDNKLQLAWTYFIVDVPRGAAGGNLQLELKSDAKIKYEIYIRFGGIPSIDIWDYQTNGTSTDNDSIFRISNGSGRGNIKFLMLYVREGIWVFGLRHPLDAQLSNQDTMSVALEGCPDRCSNSGKCHSAVDDSGLTLYSYCTCDRRHGGFDCSVELVSHEEHMWQSIALIFSNIAAVFPALWALRQKAFAEWVLFTSSGLSSGLYHACDVGSWCALSFHVLQFMDFWLSFVAVVSTFIYMAKIEEVSKRAIHTSVAILTALIAAEGPTRSENIIIVVSLGILGLVVGWMIELYSSRAHTLSCPQFNLNVMERWQELKTGVVKLIDWLRKRFQWRFIFLGFIALLAAGTCWNLESVESYWIWHSLWHVSIYTASFFFLCSTSVNIIQDEEQETPYELVRQNSSVSGQRPEAAPNPTNGVP
ncbi:hypothetical protein AMTR_s00009p00201120 [Amborella trichopoda]|uniref:EGF-like domain-containing protein n=3 Tax=Amborella trichopoda TaxID=13333 RepID=W1NHI1_AMBTC|nr:hypothetical protein AMTR_s00009p00201120 [Amborella trichopoda]